MEMSSESPLEIEPTEGKNISEGDIEVFQNNLTQELIGENIKFENGLAVNVSAQQDISIRDSLVFVTRAGGDIEVGDSGGLAMVSGGNLKLTNGGAQVIVAGGNFDLTNGGAQIMVVGGNLTAQKSFVGVALTDNLSLSDDSKVLLDKPRAILFGAAFGAVFAVLSWLLKRRS